MARASCMKDAGSLTPAGLTAILRHAGVLERGEVIDVTVEMSRETLVSRIARLRLTYADGAAGPSHVFVKSRRAEADPSLQLFGVKEAAFYRNVAAGSPAGLLPRCYEASAEPSSDWRLILEDLSASHQTLGEWPLPPALDRVHAVLIAHAKFHAAWWSDARLGVSVGTFLDDTGALDQSVAALPKDLAAFADRLGDRLSAERRRLYERLITAAPRLLDRYRTHRNLTIVHGDAHVWNALLPRDAGRHDLRLIDWDGWRVDTASDDLAYMLAVHFFPDWRSRHERDSLRHYHDTLLSGDVRDYPFEALWQDYRLSALWHLTTPMWQANHGLPAGIWWNHLDRIMSAVHDLGCQELLD